MFPEISGMDTNWSEVPHGLGTGLDWWSATVWCYIDLERAHRYLVLAR